MHLMVPSFERCLRCKVKAVWAPSPQAVSVNLLSKNSKRIGFFQLQISIIGVVLKMYHIVGWFHTSNLMMSEEYRSGLALHDLTDKINLGFPMYYGST